MIMQKAGPRDCPWCGKKFLATSRTIYCSVKCRYKFNAKIQWERDLVSSVKNGTAGPRSILRHMFELQDLSGFRDSIMWRIGKDRSTTGDLVSLAILDSGLLISDVVRESGVCSGDLLAYVKAEIVPSFVVCLKLDRALGSTLSESLRFTSKKSGTGTAGERMINRNVLSGRKREFTLGGAVTCLRLEFGLTQEELADQIGVSASSISKLERGVVIPTAETVSYLSQFFQEDLSGRLKNAKARALQGKPCVVADHNCRTTTISIKGAEGKIVLSKKKAQGLLDVLRVLPGCNKVNLIELKNGKEV
jgi:transcriptional regulator with XRE-family HTH domain